MNFNRLNLILALIATLLCAAPSFAQLSTVGPDHALNVQDAGIREFTFQDLSTFTENIFAVGTNPVLLTDMKDPSGDKLKIPYGVRGMYVYSTLGLYYGGKIVWGAAGTSAATIAAGGIPIEIATTTATLIKFAPDMPKIPRIYFGINGTSATSSVTIMWVK